MSTQLLQPQPAASAVPPFPNERRRPGRIANASPELIALMRKPTPAARMRVALYDAPGFLLPEAPRARPADRRSLARCAVAMAACSVLCTAAFQGMIAVWG